MCFTEQIETKIQVWKRSWFCENGCNGTEWSTVVFCYEKKANILALTGWLERRMLSLFPLFIHDLLEWTELLLFFFRCCCCCCCWSPRLEDEHSVRVFCFRICSFDPCFQMAQNGVYVFLKDQKPCKTFLNKK